MRLSLSVAAKSNGFSKAIRRIRPKFSTLFAEFEAKELENPIHEAILLGISDSLKEEEIQVIPNKDGFFQVICGFGEQASLSPENDSKLEVMLLNKIENAIQLCPFSKPDKAAMLELLREWSSNELRGTGET